MWLGSTELGEVSELGEVGEVGGSFRVPSSLGSVEVLLPWLYLGTNLVYIGTCGALT